MRSLRLLGTRCLLQVARVADMPRRMSQISKTAGSPWLPTAHARARGAFSVVTGRMATSVRLRAVRGTGPRGPGGRPAARIGFGVYVLDRAPGIGQRPVRGAGLHTPPSRGPSGGGRASASDDRRGMVGPGVDAAASALAFVLLSGRALARAALGWEFPISTLSIVERVPSPTMTHVSSRPP